MDRRTALGLSAGALVMPTVGFSQSGGKSYIEDRISPQHFNPVYDWLEALLGAIRDDGLVPPQSGRVLAVGFTAGFAAMNSARRVYQDTQGIPAASVDADPIAAFSAAAKVASQTAAQRSFGGTHARVLRLIPDGPRKANGISLGLKVGQVFADRRARDGSEETASIYYRGIYQKRNHILSWEPTLPHFRGGTGPRIDPFTRPVLPAWGYVKPYGIRSAKRYRADIFPDPASQVFWDDVRLIKALGGTKSRVRDANESQVAFFWEDGPRGATTCGHFQLIAAQLMQGRMSVFELARAMMLVAMSQGDAGICAWDSKYIFDIVRPETIIRRRMRTLPGFDRRQVDLDPRWTSLILTPPFPAYTSGHSTFGAAGARMMQLILGTDRARFTLRPPDLAWWPDQLSGVSRSYNSIWRTAEENGLSRLYGGVHWSFDHDQGMTAGKGIAEEIFARQYSQRV